MVWREFSWRGIGLIVLIVFKYKNLIGNAMKPYAFEFTPRDWQWVAWKNKKMNVLDCIAQSPDLNPIKNCCEEASLFSFSGGLGRSPEAIFTVFSLPPSKPYPRGLYRRVRTIF